MDISSAYDNDGIDIGNVIEMKKTKRTFKGVVVKTHYTVRDRYNLPEIIIIPVAQLGRTTEVGEGTVPQEASSRS